MHEFFFCPTLFLDKLLCAFAGTRCWVTGWGQDAFQGDGEMQATLQEVDVPIVDPDYCEKALKKEGLGYRYDSSEWFMEIFKIEILTESNTRIENGNLNKTRKHCL